jgi:hypothetical protein
MSVTFVRRMLCLAGLLLCVVCDACDRAAGSVTAADAASPPPAADPCLSATPSAAPASVTEVVDLVNTLPKPTALSCLLSSLPGPLPLVATRSVFSAQPAVGQRSPRIFLLYSGLTMSIALDGMGKDLLEFGEHRPEQRSLKAEIEFPVADELTHDAPFQRILYQAGQTSCAFCHRNESRDDAIDFAEAFVSIAYRPANFQAAVSVSELAQLRAECDAEAEPQRCAVLQSLFARGMPIDQSFPVDYATFQ